MANHKATKKDTRQANKRRERNRYHGKTTRNAMRDLLTVSSEGEAKDKLKKVEAMLDKLAKRNIIHKNKASNLKSALSKKINALATAVEAPVKVKKAPTKKTNSKKVKPAEAVVTENTVVNEVSAETENTSIDQTSTETENSVENTSAENTSEETTTKE